MDQKTTRPVCDNMDWPWYEKSFYLVFNTFILRGVCKAAQ